MSTTRFLAAFMVLAACDSASAPEPVAEPEPNQSTNTPSDKVLADGLNDFAARLYTQIDEEADAAENIFFSPFSIDTAFGILAIGARGDTDAQIREVLGLPIGEDADQRLGDIARSLSSSGKNGAPQLSIANALWVQRDFPLRPEYRERARSAFDAKAANVDFRRDAEAAAGRINRWVAENTNDRIDSIVSARALSPDTILVITNAIYFLGKWQMEFSPDLTQNQPFTLGDGSQADIPLMYREKRVRYVETESYQAVDLPYRESDLVMSVVLPREGTDLDEIEARIAGGETASILSALDAATARDVFVYLPKLEIETDYDLIPHLQKMGLGLPFGPRADLSGIADAGLAVDAALHKAFLKIDESGTEAAAVTAIAVVETSAAIGPTPTFRADSPFLFAIRDRASGTILFLGRISDPREKT